MKSARTKAPVDSASSIDWYEKARPIYEGLAEGVRTILEGQLKAAEIDFLSVTARAKTTDGLTEKLRRKTYRNPKKEIHDLAGIRVITYIEGEARRVAKIVTRLFNVHTGDTLDKSAELGVDRIGYRSMHLVCDLGERRCALPEFAPYKGLSFEIQVRTVLQHAWAEIEHDRNYKFTGLLPPELQRRLNLAAGTLEMVDREFDALGEEIDRYSAAVARKTDAGDLDIEVNTKSLLEYLRSRRLASKGLAKGAVGSQSNIPYITDEVRRFGLSSLAQVDALFSNSLVGVVNKLPPAYLGFTGLLRTAMIWNDIDRYFTRSWQKGRSWVLMPRVAYDLFCSKYGNKKVDGIMRRLRLKIEEQETPARIEGRRKGRKKRGQRKFKKKAQ